MPAEADTLWLEFLEPGKFRLQHRKRHQPPQQRDPAAESAFQLTLNTEDESFLRAAPHEHASLPLLRWPAKLPNSAPMLDRSADLSTLVRDMACSTIRFRTAKTVFNASAAKRYCATKLAWQDH